MEPTTELRDVRLSDSLTNLIKAIGDLAENADLWLTGGDANLVSISEQIRGLAKHAGFALADAMRLEGELAKDRDDALIIARRIAQEQNAEVEAEAAALRAHVAEAVSEAAAQRDLVALREQERDAAEALARDLSHKNEQLQATIFTLEKAVGKTQEAPEDAEERGAADAGRASEGGRAAGA